MKVEQKDLGKGKIELTVEIPFEDFSVYFKKGAEDVSKETKIDGFREGKAPYDIVKQKVGELPILEKAARLAIIKTVNEAIGGLGERLFSQPEISIIKLAPGNPLEYKAVFSVLPKMEKLGEYKNLGVKKEKVEVRDKEVKLALEGLLERRSSEVLVERESRAGDKALLDIEMFLDRVPIEGGKSNGTAVILGKDYLLPGFDKEIMGMKKDEVREFKVPYPENFYQKSIAGKLVEFRVKMKEVYERRVPELTDELARSLGSGDADGLKKEIKETIHTRKESQAQNRANMEILDKIIAGSRFTYFPEELVNREVEQQIARMKTNIEEAGGKFDDYLASIKKTRSEFALDLAPEALKRIKTVLILEEIFKKEKITVSEEELKKETEGLFRQARGNKEMEDRLKSQEYQQRLKLALEDRKIWEKLRDWNIAKE